METPRNEYLWRKAKQRAGFKIHLRSYLIVNTGLWLIYFYQWAITHSVTFIHGRCGLCLAGESGLFHITLLPMETWMKRPWQTGNMKN